MSIPHLGDVSSEDEAAEVAHLDPWAVSTYCLLRAPSTRRPPASYDHVTALAGALAVEAIVTAAADIVGGRDRRDALDAYIRRAQVTVIPRAFVAPNVFRKLAHDAPLDWPVRLTFAAAMAVRALDLLVPGRGASGPAPRRTDQAPSTWRSGS